MPSIILDFDPPLTAAPGFSGDQSDLVYFLSWAYSARYGAQHELSLAAVTLQGDLKVNIRPLMNFADREVEEVVDEETLELAWQDAGPLADSCNAVAAALDEDDARFAGVVEEYPRLVPCLRELGLNAARQADNGGRIRVTYRLDDD